MELCLFSQLTSVHRLSFLLILDFLLRTALESDGQKSEILQMELLVSGLAKVDRRSLNSTSGSKTKPHWLESDVVWFDIVSLSNLFSADDVLHHLCQWMISDEDKWREFYLHPQLNSLSRWQDRPVSSLDRLLIIRLLRPDRLLDALTDYLVDRFTLAKILSRSPSFDHVNIVTLPSLAVQCKGYGDYLINQIDFDRVLVDLVQRGGRRVRQIDCRLEQLDHVKQTDTPRSDLIVWKNVSRASPIKELLRE
jgi:hypothetical protein